MTADDHIKNEARKLLQECAFEYRLVGSMAVRGSGTDVDIAVLTVSENKARRLISGLEALAGDPHGLLSSGDSYPGTFTRIRDGLVEFLITDSVELFNAWVIGAELGKVLERLGVHVDKSMRIALVEMLVHGDDKIAVTKALQHKGKS